jgi:hypothetical protein
MPKAEVKVFPSTVRITIHDPISTAGYSKENVVELMERTRAKIFSALDETEARMNGALATLDSKQHQAAK